MIMLAPQQPGVSLSALLAAKEQRAHRQQSWLARHHAPLISLTLVTPGSVKDSIQYRNLMGVALVACDQLLWQHRWPVLAREVNWLDTGAEALWSVDHNAAELKASCVALEQEHPLGRLWDFDVFDPDIGQIGRHSLDRAGRRCLICGEPAHACSRSRRHPVEQVVAEVEKRIDDWFTRD